MIKRSPEDFWFFVFLVISDSFGVGGYKGHGEPKDYKGSRKPRNPGSPQESGKTARVKEDCQVSRIQNLKSLED